MHLSKKHIVTAIATLTLFAGLSMSAQAANVYHFGISDQRTNITFQSETDFETVLGSTRKLTGTVTADFDQGKAEIAVTVPVSSLRTGIDMRDEHLRSPMWLDADRYPEISFVSTDSKKIGRDRWRVSGTFTLHDWHQIRARQLKPYYRRERSRNQTHRLCPRRQRSAFVAGTSWCHRR